MVTCDNLDFYNEIEESIKTPNVNNTINYFIKLTNEWFNKTYNYGFIDCPNLYFYAFPIGSITYHRLFPCNRKDFLICFPDCVLFTDLKDSFIPFIIRCGKIISLITINNKVGELKKIKFQIEHHLFDISISILPLDYCRTKKPNFNLINPPNDFITKLSKQSLYCLNYLRDCLIIHRIIKPNIKIFKITLFYLKKWALVKLIYSKLFYLNGASLTIMLAYIFQNNIPANTIYANLYLFFRYFTEFNWSNCVLDLTYNDDIIDFKERRTSMNILTPTKPKRNCSKYINKYSLNRILNYFREALFQLEKSAFKISYSEHFQQPLTLMEFYNYIIQTIYKPKQFKFPLKIIIISLIENEKLNDAVYLQMWYKIKRNIIDCCQKYDLLPFPLSFYNNIIKYSNIIYRRRHIILFCCDSIVLSNVEEYFEQLLINNNGSVTIYFSHTNDFNDIITLNLDHYLYMSKLIEFSY